MKKFYSFIAMAMLTVSAQAQVTYDLTTVAPAAAEGGGIVPTKYGNGNDAGDMGFQLTNEDGTVSYTRNHVARQWDDKMYLFPIPQTERMKNPNLEQNTGW